MKSFIALALLSSMSFASGINWVSASDVGIQACSAREGTLASVVTLDDLPNVKFSEEMTANIDGTAACPSHAIYSDGEVCNLNKINVEEGKCHFNCSFGIVSKQLNCSI